MVIITQSILLSKHDIVYIIYRRFIICQTYLSKAGGKKVNKSGHEKKIAVNNGVFLLTRKKMQNGLEEDWKGNVVNCL